RREAVFARAPAPERPRATPQLLVRSGQTGALADKPYRATLAPALAEARVEHRRFEPGVGGDEQNPIGLLNPPNAAVKKVARPPTARIELGTVLAAVEVRCASAREEIAQRTPPPRATKPASNAADPVGLCRLQPGGAQVEYRIPARWLQPPVGTYIGPIEALRPQSVCHKARLVGNPLLVHRVVVARQ